MHDVKTKKESSHCSERIRVQRISHDALFASLWQPFVLIACLSLSFIDLI